jgi:hypothetical protein
MWGYVLMIRMVMTKFAFNGMPKGLRFTFDDQADTGVQRFIDGGYLIDITDQEHRPDATIISMPSIDSNEEIGDIGGTGADQPPQGRKGRQRAVQAAGAEGVPGDQGDGAEVAEGR